MISCYRISDNKYGIIIAEGKGNRKIYKGGGVGGKRKKF
jgi:hypothetical protein